MDRYIKKPVVNSGKFDSIEEDRISEIETLRNICRPICEYINEHYDPYTQIIITDKQVKIMKDEIGIPM
ncbi:hypothetical protein UMC2_34971 [[Clostridium] sordellii]|uniref:hypothetical protein n=1 Tax=Paraclostridium sordellii TaxID=1505 RepID=UPI000541BC90|nr:hypothetical protein [Paeniclostridium sordellii]CEK34286.1 hypothetical protein UMC2_34971 [[Clostridium] sordellii] [Paeniclostridium sordellii]